MLVCGEGASGDLNATATGDGRGRNQKWYSTARAELDLLMKSARVLVDAEHANDPTNQNLALIDGGIARTRARFDEQTFTVAVLALVKSGKSTLINALLGQNFLPSSNVPETARIVRIKHAAGDADGSLRHEGQLVARGADEIRSYLRRLNAQSRGSGDPSGGDDLVLEAPLAALTGRTLGDHPFEILDTPGTNEAGADGLRTCVDRLLVDANVILYLLDYTKLRTVEECSLFNRLAAMRPELLCRMSDRLFFAVNKIDLENSNGLSPAATRDYVARLLREQVPGLAIDPDRILLLSAEHGLLARRVLAGRDGDGGLRDFARLCFGIRGQDATTHECRRHAGDVLESSRLLEVEARVVSFLCGHGGEIFLAGVLEHIDRDVSNLDNHMGASRRALQLEHGKLADRIAALEGDLRDTEQAFDGIDGLSIAIAGALETWVHERFSSFRDEVEADLVRAFGTEADGKSATTGDGVGQDAHGGAGASWHDFAAVFAACEGEPEADDEGSAQYWVAEANQGVAAVLRSRFATFWSELELAAWERQRHMLGEIEDRLAPMASRIADEVGRRLEIVLRPVRLEIPPQSFDDLHQELVRQLDRFVERRTWQERGSHSRRVRVKRAGWCTEDTYQRRSIAVTRDVTSFVPDSNGLLEYWRGWIRSRTEVSIATARAIVRARVGAALRA